MVTIDKNNGILKNLFQESIDGNKESYSKFLYNISKIIRPIISRKISSSEVDDVIQEILLSIDKSLHTYDCSRKIMPWIMSSVNYRIADHLRKHYSQMRHKKTYIENIDFEEIISDVTSVDKTSELIDDIFDGMSIKLKTIITMMYIEGYSAKEVAKKIGMSESAIKVAAHREIKKLKNKYLNI